MSGVMGVVTSAAGECVPEILERMLKPVLQRPGLRAERLHNNQAGLVAVMGERVDLNHHISFKQDTWLAVSGHIVQQDELARRLDGPVPYSGGLANLLLDVYLSCGLEAVCGLNGEYVLAIWDAIPRRLTIVKDRLGAAANLYYWYTPGRLMFASEIKSFAWHPQFDQEIDPVGAADMFINLGPAMGRTLFRQARRLMGGDLLTYQDERLDVSAYWKPQYAVMSDLAGKEDEYIDGMAHHIRVAVKRRARANSCMLVTGGLDARTVLGFYRTDAPDLSLSAATVGKPGGLDLQIGKEVAEAYGVQHHWLPLDDHYLEKYAALSAWRAEGKMPGYASWIFATEPFVKDLGFKNVLTGLYGNFISGRHYPAGMSGVGSLDSATEQMRQIGQSAAKGLKRILRPAVAEQAIAESTNVFAELFLQAPAELLLNRFDHVIMRTIMANAATGYDALGDVVTVLDPFTDTDLLDYTLKMPPQVRANPWFYLRLIDRYLPEAAAQTHGRTGYSVKTDLFINQHSMLRRLDYYRRRAIKRLMPARFNDEARGCVPFNEALRKGSRPLMLQVLEQVEDYQDLFDPAAVRQMFEEQQAGRETHLYVPLTTLMTLVLFRQQMRNLQ